MDKNNETNPVEEIVYTMLETLKSNGTFDEFRRHCISDIDTKPTYQNWKQRIESNVNKFLSTIIWTPELNINIVRERLRKHLYDGRNNHDLEEGADRILNQLMASRTINLVEDKIEIVVNEYLGIKNDAPPTEINGLKNSSMNLQKVSEVEINTISNPKIDLITDTENAEEISPEFEPITSVLHNENSNDESISGMSDLVSVGSPLELISKENHNTNSNGFETDKNSIEEGQQTPFDKNGVINCVNNSIKHDDTKISNRTIRLKTNDSKSKSKHHSSRTSRQVDITSSQEKSSAHRSKDHNSSRYRSTSRENDIKKKNSNCSKDRKSSSHNKHYNESKDKKHKHDKKSHHDRDKTQKRDRKESRTDKKEKSSSLCKEPKSLNSNRSDDESNAGGSSRQKSNIHKNKSSTSDKSKSSSSNHKSSRKDNGSKDVVDKSKDKSISKNSVSLREENNTFNPKWNRCLTNCRTNDENDAISILLSMSKLNFDSSHNDKTENIIFIANSLTNETLNTTENKLDVQENSNETKILQFNDNINIKDNLNLNKNNFKMPQMLNSIGSINKSNVLNSENVINVCENNISNSVENVCEDNVSNSTEVENVCEDNVSNSTEVENVGEDNVSNSTEVKNIHENNISNSTEVKNVNENNVSNSVELKNVCEDNVSNSDEVKNVCEDNVSNSDEVKNVCEDNVSNFDAVKNVCEDNVSNSDEVKHVCEDNVSNFDAVKNVCEDNVSNSDEVENNISITFKVKNGCEDNVSNSIEVENICEDNVSNSTEVENVHENNISNSTEVENACEDSVLNSVEVQNVCVNNISNFVAIEKCTLTPKYFRSENNVIENTKKVHENKILFELDTAKNKIETVNSEVNLNLTQITNECNFNEILRDPKLKLLTNDLIEIQNKRKEHHTLNKPELKKFKLSKSNITSGEINVPITDTVSTTVTYKQNDQIIDFNTNIQINDSVETLSDQVLLKDVNTITLDSDELSYTFKGFSQTDAVPCKNYKLMIELYENLKTKRNDEDEFKSIENEEDELEGVYNDEDEFKGIDNNGDELKNVDYGEDEFKGFENVEDGFKGFEKNDRIDTRLQQKLIIVNEFAGFKGFSVEDIMQIDYEYNHAKQQLELAKKEYDMKKQNQNITSGKNGIQNGKKSNQVMPMVYENNEKNDETPDEFYNPPIHDKKECSAVNNNNHDITASENWVVEQEMKYKLLPVKVKLERLIGINHICSKPIGDSPEVPSSPKRNKFM